MQALLERAKAMGKADLFDEVLIPEETVVEMVKGVEAHVEAEVLPRIHPRAHGAHGRDLAHRARHAEDHRLRRVATRRRRRSPDDEVARKMTQQIKEGAAKPKPKIMFDEGESVRVISGPFANFSGYIDEVMEDKEKLKVMVHVFGRATPVVLGLHERREGHDGEGRSCPRTRQRNSMAKKVIASREAAVPRRAGEPLAAGRSGARPARRQHHGVLQGVQRAHAGQAGPDHPAIISIYADRSFTFELKTPPAAVLLKRAAKIAKGSGEPNREKVGTVTSEPSSRRSPSMKAPDLNAHDVDAAMNIISGTARSMGLDVVEG